MIIATMPVILSMNLRFWMGVVLMSYVADRMLLCPGIHIQLHDDARKRVPLQVIMNCNFW
jgi:hypothetical protein